MEEDPRIDHASGETDRREERSPLPRPQLDPAPVEPYLDRPAPASRAEEWGRRAVIGILAAAILSCGLYVFLPAPGVFSPTAPGVMGDTTKVVSPPQALEPPALALVAPPHAPEPVSPLAPPQAAALEGMVQRENVEGSWSGRYYYPATSGDKAPVHFTMVFAQTGNRIEGQISEPNTFGADSAMFLQAGISGIVSPGGKVTFTKVYDGTGRVGHAVEYSGVLSPDGRSISGTWTIPGAWSGAFEMSR